FFFFQAEDGIRDRNVTGVQTCALPISCWTCGLIPVPCLLPRCTTHLRTRNGLIPTHHPTSSWNTSDKPAAGSTCCTYCPPRSLTARRLRRSSPTASCWVMTD